MLFSLFEYPIHLITLSLSCLERPKSRYSPLSLSVVSGARPLSFLITHIIATIYTKPQIPDTEFVLGFLEGLIVLFAPF